MPVVLVSAQYGSPADHDLAGRVGANALLLRTPDLGRQLLAFGRKRILRPVVLDVNTRIRDLETMRATPTMRWCGTVS